MTSAPYEADNLLDRLTSTPTLAVQTDQLMRREREILSRRVRIGRGDVLSVGCGWNPGRHLFPEPAFRLVAVDSDPGKVAGVLAEGRADEAFVGEAGTLGLAPGSFDVVLYRLVLHHLAYQGPLEPVFDEAARLLRPGGALVAIEPGSWHPVGMGLSLANRLGVATRIHGTPDDIPLSPSHLLRLARGAGLEPEIHAVTFSWRRLPPSVQRALHGLDRLGSRPRAALAGHTLMLIARKLR